MKRICGLALLIVVPLLGVSVAEARQTQVADTHALKSATPVTPAATDSATRPSAVVPTTKPAITPASSTVAPPQGSEAPQSLHLLVGRSLVVTSPGRIKRISLADPDIAEAIVVSPHEVLLNGKKPGGVSFLLWDETDQSQAFEVSVDIDIQSLSEQIRKSFPSEPVQLAAAGDVVMISGKVSSPEVAGKILEFVKAATPKVTSLMEVPVPPLGDILLEVKFADVQKTYLNQLGINILSLPGAKNIGTIGTEQFSPPTLSSLSTTTSGTGTGTPTSTLSSAFNLSDLLNLFIFRPDINLAATIKALQENNILQILAEPNLLTASGKEASFLAGGEFPYPVLQGSTGGTAGAITIQFKEFGVRLNFTPTLEADGYIHLKVQPEVSSLDFANALTIQGFLIPALTTTRIQSEMDLKDGQSFAIAGLMDDRVTEVFQKIPWIGDIPILGNLFKSRSLQKSKNELLVIVTPRLVHPLNAGELPVGPVFPKSFLPPFVPETPKNPKGQAPTKQ